MLLQLMSLVEDIMREMQDLRDQNKELQKKITELMTEVSDFIIIWLFLCGYYCCCYSVRLLAFYPRDAMLTRRGVFRGALCEAPLGRTAVIFVTILGLF